MKRFFVLISLLFVILLSACGNNEVVKVASKQNTESILLAEMYAQLIENNSDIKVERKMNLGGTVVCMSALKEGEIDICPMYTGTLYSEVLKHEIDGSATIEEIRDVCKKEMDSVFSLTMFDPQGHNNTYALAIKKDRIAEIGTCISDLSDFTNFSFGAGHIFYTRELDGYDGLINTYGLEFKEALKMDSTLLYEAIDKGDLDVIVVFSTDALLRKYELVCLKDDRNLFPPYEGVIVCRNEVLDKYPELNEILNKLADIFDDDSIQELNYQIDIQKRSVEEVAGEFLRNKGLIAD